jgi:hypothetical protein
MFSIMFLLEVLGVCALPSLDCARAQSVMKYEQHATFSHVANENEWRSARSYIYQHMFLLEVLGVWALLGPHCVRTRTLMEFQQHASRFLRVNEPMNGHDLCIHQHVRELACNCDA